MPHQMGLPMPQMTFNHLEPMTLDLARYEVEDKSQTQIRHDFICSPNEKLRDYFLQRFKAIPSHPASVGELSAIIEKAEIEYIPYPERFWGGGKDIYRVKLDVLLSSFNHQDYAYKAIGIRWHRDIEVSKHATIAEREKKQLEAMEDIMRELDKRVVQIVRGDLRI